MVYCMHFEYQYKKIVQGIWNSLLGILEHMPFFILWNHISFFFPLSQIIHRLVIPMNVYLFSNGRAKLANFYFAISSSSESQSDPVSQLYYMLFTLWSRTMCTEMYKYFWKFLTMEINLRRRKKPNLYTIVCYGLIFKNLHVYGM